MTDRILVFLFELGWGVKFNIVGQISLSELFLIIYVPFLIAKIKWKASKDLQAITIAYSVLLSVQLLSEYLIGNGVSNSMKGLAITIVSYLHFIFLFYYLCKSKSYILIIILSQIVTSLMFDSFVEEQSAEEIIAGEAAVYLKFYIAPLTILSFLVISILYNNRNMPILFSLLGIGFVVLGARSSGIMTIFAGIIAYLMEHKHLISNKRILIWVSAILIIISYVGYIYYVNLVISGKITSGNSQQLLICKNPYNPIELLMAGRREVWVGWQAFMDRFWLGHGAWPYDTTGYYQRLMYEMSGNLSALTKNQISYHFLIPSHSVIIGAGMMNGIFAFLTMVFIIYYFLKKGVLSLWKCEQKYLLVLAYFEYNLFWNALFSPQSHFRQTLPIAFAIILILYLSSKSPKINSYSYEQNPCNNSNVR